MPTDNRDMSLMRDRIKSLALDLLIQHGYRGVSFGDLADVLKTTRANIHYHFGNKRALVEEVLEDYIKETLAGMRGALEGSDRSLLEKIEAVVDISRKRHAHYNPPGKQGRPWSLIARMRQDSDALSPKGRAALKRFARDLEKTITQAIADAKRRGEFVKSMPVDDVALQLVGIANSAGPITQDAGNFDRLEQLYMAYGQIIQHAYGRRKDDQPKVRARTRGRNHESHPTSS